MIKSFWVIPILMLSACSSNISSEWDCPRQEGHGCVMINEADKMAIEKTGRERHKVWFAPDKSGNRHGEVFYHEKRDVNAINEEGIKTEKLPGAVAEESNAKNKPEGNK